MILYKYHFDVETTSIKKECLDVAEREKSYIFTSNPRKKILKSKIDKPDPDSNDLYSFNEDLNYAKLTYKKMFQNQSEAFQRTVSILEQYIQELS